MTLFAANARAIAPAEAEFQLCAACHGNQGEGNEKLGAPSIAGLPEWYVEGQLYKFRDGVRGLHPKDKGGMRMRPMARTLKKDEEFKAIATYVAAMPKPDLKATVAGSIAKGEVKYQQICIACHGPMGEGNQALGAPPLVGGSDWYFITQLHNFKDGIRGTSSGDTTGMTMRPMAIGLSDDDMKDAVSYINVLKRFKGK